MHALGLASELRIEGENQRARAIAERALETLRSDPGAAGTVYVEWASARFELLCGSSFMDEDRPAEAERVSLAAIRRLEAMENTFGERSGDARDGQLRMVRALLADAWMSLAVNANVRQHDTDRALEYFEKAYELNQNPFMRVLRACYRARSGRADEARAILASVTPSPNLFYNTACTWALLGEVDLAVDYLERDFRANYPTPGSLARQREWARGDPDLINLRGDPRFQRLTAE
jgi:tetratricopeptide (TPR) repeat protein